MQSSDSRSDGSRGQVSWILWLIHYLLDSESVVELRELPIGFLLCTDSLALYSSSAIVRIGRIDLELQESNQPRSTPIRQSDGPIQIHIKSESTLELQIDPSPIRSLLIRKLG